jgi:hypothetical protein
MLDSMALRPRMYGTPCCVEGQARQAMWIRRMLLGAPDDGLQGVYERLLCERFRTSVYPASHYIDAHNEQTAAEKIGEFVAEWWRREQDAVPDPAVKR